jgi:hypothetical protein
MPIAARGPLLVVRPGDRVKFRTPTGLKVGVVESIDEDVFPGVVIVRDDSGERHVIHIHVGWED